MLDNKGTFFFGVATNEPNNGRKKPEQPQLAIGDIAYYYAPGETHGCIATVNGYSRDENGRINYNLTVMATGEEVTATAGQVKC